MTPAEFSSMVEKATAAAGVATGSQSLDSQKKNLYGNSYPLSSPMVSWI